jgi:hypothetical protein
LFSIYKQTSFVTEINYVLARCGGALAAKWHYSDQDEECSYSKTYDHRLQNSRVYAVRDSWAMQRGLMKAAMPGYLDDAIRPAQDVGCCCSLQYLYTLSDLPDAMLTNLGRAELHRVRDAVANLLAETPAGTKTASTANSPQKRGARMIGWFIRKP